MSRNDIIPYRQDLKKLARNLRKNMTHAEVLLWQHIRKKQLGVKFHRQVPMLDYIIDFYCHELKLAIEVDGGVHDHPEVSVKDLERQEQIEAYDVLIIRFENKEIKKDIEQVLENIRYAIKALRPQIISP
jgi:very-short-patch-repair endonuclease